jgi:hypothetical protein
MPKAKIAHVAFSKATTRQRANSARATKYPNYSNWYDAHNVKALEKGRKFFKEKSLDCSVVVVVVVVVVVLWSPITLSDSVTHDPCRIQQRGNEIRCRDGCFLLLALASFYFPAHNTKIIVAIAVLKASPWWWCLADEDGRASTAL